MNMDEVRVHASVAQKPHSKLKINMGIARSDSDSPIFPENMRQINDISQ